jgi:regulator of PEP synthase PpsR (kinase-PPPase family)
MKKDANKKLLVHVLSDSTGNLAQHMLAAMLTQFPPGSFQTSFKTFLRTEPQLAEALKQVAAEGGIIMHALVSNDAKEQIAEFCRKRHIPAKDLTGLFVEFLAQTSGLEPSADWRDLHRVDDAYHRRISAIEYTLAHDDGLGLETLADAEVVLVGVSRTSKTPTSIYLSQMGYRAANVALAKGIDPPAALLAMPKEKVVALVIDPMRLSDIRRRRQAEWNMSSNSYDEMDSVREEITWSRRLFARQGWPILDVTNNAIEETAARVVDLLHLPRAAGL